MMRIFLHGNTMQTNSLTTVLIVLSFVLLLRNRGIDMTKIDFLILCGEYLIDPSVALENKNIRQALQERDNEQVKTILQNEF